MNPFLSSILSQLVVQGLISPDSNCNRNSWRPLLMMSAFGLFALGVTFAFMAGYEWLSGIYNTLEIKILGMAAALSLALILFVVSFVINKRQKTLQYRTENALMHKTEEILDAIAGEFEEPIQSNPKTAVIMAALAGILAGNKLSETAPNPEER